METLIALGFGLVWIWVVRQLFKNGERAKQAKAEYISSCYRNKVARQCRSEFAANIAMDSGRVKGWN